MARRHWLDPLARRLLIATGQIPAAAALAARQAALEAAARQADHAAEVERELGELKRARAAGLQSIFVLTTRTMHWFIKRGFVQMDPDWLPDARKRKYNWDRKSQVLMKKLS